MIVKLTYLIMANQSMFIHVCELFKTSVIFIPSMISALETVAFDKGESFVSLNLFLKYKYRHGNICFVNYVKQ